MKFKNTIKINTKVSFSSSEQGFFGPGVCHLLECIDTCGSIQEASERMHISYSKARKILNKLQKECSFLVVEKQVGGICGGSSKLTEEGKQLVKQYLELEKRVKEDAEALYYTYFGE